MKTIESYITEKLHLKKGSSCFDVQIKQIEEVKNKLAVHFDLWRKDGIDYEFETKEYTELEKKYLYVRFTSKKRVLKRQVNSYCATINRYSYNMNEKFHCFYGIDSPKTFHFSITFDD